MNSDKAFHLGNDQRVSEEWAVQWQGIEYGFGNLCLGFCIDKITDDDKIFFVRGGVTASG